MSRENVEALRRVHEAWERGDYSDASIYDPEVEFVSLEGVGPNVSHGLAEMSAAWRDVLSAYGRFRSELGEIFDAGDKVVVFIVAHFTVKGSDTELTTRTAAVWTMRNGKAVRLALYLDREQALRDAGLDPGLASPRA